MPQIPRAAPGLICPLWKKDMSKVCHTCPLWVLIRGKHPQSNQDVDSWNCALAWLPWLMVENSQMQRQTGAAVESFRNESVTNHCESLATMMTGNPANAAPLIARRLGNGPLPALPPKGNPDA